MGLVAANWPSASTFVPHPTINQLSRGLPLNAFVEPANTALFSLDPNFRDPYVQHWNFSVQRDLGWGAVWEISYAGSSGKKLYEFRDANQPAPTAKASAFPTAQGKTLDTLRAGLPEGPILAPSTTSSLHVGSNRLGFALFNKDRSQILNAAVALYTTAHDGTNVKGPYVARFESLKVKSQYESKTTANDPDGAKAVYVSTIPIPHSGRTVVTSIQ